MKINFITVVTFYLFSSPLMANFNDAFLEDVIDITQLEFSDGSFYQGQVSECLLDLIVISCMHGKGVYTFKTGSKYTGEFSNNKPNGVGFFKYVNGQSYTGNYKDGIMSGDGIMLYPDGRLYEGEFLNNQRNGYGVMIYQDVSKYQEGSRYEGEWLNDMRHGNGEMIYLNDGRRLKGLFKENTFIGG